MFDDQPKILAEELTPTGDAEDDNRPEDSRPPLKKILLIAGAALLLAFIIGATVFLIIKKPFEQKTPTSPTIIATATPIVSGSTTVLPDFSQTEEPTSATSPIASSSLAVEYLSFADFYEAPDSRIDLKIADYELPLNVKLDVMNYYDVSRKINLDPGLDSLNNNGFAVVDNPWEKEAAGFYAVYNNLNDKQIPLLVTADFLIYNYQNILKRAFKDVEENVFYDNLWEINKELYTVARERYEARLAAIGQVNDSILEGERLEMAFFATALELLKPAKEQISAAGEAGKFTSADADRFYFVVPPYLRDDVLAEVKLTREAKAVAAKSPVMLYTRNYQDFVVPPEYKTNAKLNNFYLTTKWLASVFPLNYRDKNCANCLLDPADWRINLIAASLIAQDFSDQPNLKNKWARIYKVMSFFKGLREDLNYVHYRDSLSAVFGADYKITELFDDSNQEAVANLEKLRAKLLTYKFSEITGAPAASDPSFKTNAGFKMLAEPYWPNDYFFSRLTAPKIGTYIGTTTATNITACSAKDKNRCNGIGLDIVNLVYPVSGSDYFTENSNYAGYAAAAASLRQELIKDVIWHNNNYWATLNIIKTALEAEEKAQPLFARSADWRNHVLRTAVGAWINLQLPLEKFAAAPLSSDSGLSFSKWSENSYVEPNLDLIDELLADSNMVIRMLAALQLETEVRLATQEIKNFADSLTLLRVITVKELTGESLAAADNEMITNFTKQFTVASSTPAQKQLTITVPNQKSRLKEDLSRLDLLIITHREGDNKVFSVGPIWDYREGR